MSDTGGVSPIVNPTTTGFKDGWKSAARLRNLGLIGTAIGAGKSIYDEAQSGGFKDPVSAGLRTAAEGLALGLGGVAVSMLPKLKTGIYTSYQRSGESISTMVKNVFGSPSI